MADTSKAHCICLAAVDSIAPNLAGTHVATSALHDVKASCMTVRAEQSQVLEGQANANMEVDVNLSLGVSYHVGDARLYFPRSSKHRDTGTFRPGDSRTFRFLYIAVYD